MQQKKKKDKKLLHTITRGNVTKQNYKIEHVYDCSTVLTQKGDAAVSVTL
jgi:hypothetical protein